MRLRTKSEQKAYLDVFERCAECIKQHLSDKGKNILECQLMAARNAVEIEDVEPRVSEDNVTAERENAIKEWLGIHCRTCANNDDRGTDFLNCQAECEVQKDIGIACIHYEEAYDVEPQESEVSE